MEEPFYLKFETIQVGDCAHLNVEMSDDRVLAFSKVIGDDSSFHVSDEAAARTCFGRRICHGVHLLAYVSVAIGQKLPGFGIIYDSHSFTFHAPVYVGDSITVHLCVLEKLPGHRLRLDTEIRRGDGESVLTGQAVVKTYQ